MKINQEIKHNESVKLLTEERQQSLKGGATKSYTFESDANIRSQSNPPRWKDKR